VTEGFDATRSSNWEQETAKEELGMAVATFMHWSGVTPGEYDAMMAKLELDTFPAAGGVLHLATFGDDGLEICDVWQTEQAFYGFLENRLLPAAREVDVSGEPEVTLTPLHNLYAADPDMIDRIGALSVPAAVAAWSI
jgi:hypothetical protein